MKSESLKFTKIRKVKSPARAHSDDAGIDFFVPEDLTEEQMAPKFETTGTTPFLEKDGGKYIKSFYLNPGQSVLIPSGIKVNIPSGFMLNFFNKSGVSAKKHLLVGSCTVDENYTGEVHLNLHNVGNYQVQISAGDKIVQGIVLPVNYCDVEEVESEEKLFEDKTTERGAGGFGSTGVK